MVNNDSYKDLLSGPFIGFIECINVSMFVNR